MSDEEFDYNIQELLDQVRPEEETGHVEYKRRLDNLTETRKITLTNQLERRLHQGFGECIYYLGIDDDGIPFGLTKLELQNSQKNLSEIAHNLGCTLTTLEIKALDPKIVESRQEEKNDIMQASGGNLVATFLIRKRLSHLSDVKICMMGNVDSSKSTTLGVLLTGIRDNGRGSARKHILTHKHESETGQTSSVSSRIIGFKDDGTCVNEKYLQHRMSWTKILEESCKIISFSDLCGHRKYLCTTIRGLGIDPDYVILLIDVQRGIQPMTIEHLELCNYYNIPVIILVTKIDLCQEKSVFNKLVVDIKRLCRDHGNYRIKPLFTPKQLMGVIEDFLGPNDSKISKIPFIPLIPISCVQLKNIDLLYSFLNLLPVRNKYDRKGPARFRVHTDYLVPQVGTIAYGLVESGFFEKGQKVLLGPTSTGEYLSTVIKSIHYKRTSVLAAYAGQEICFCLRNIKRAEVRRAMVILPNTGEKLAISRVHVNLMIRRTNRSTITNKYHPYVYIGTIGASVQSFTILDAVERLQAGYSYLVELKLLRPYYIQIGDRVIIKEAVVNGTGQVTEIFRE